MSRIHFPEKIKKNAIYILCFFSFIACISYNEFNLSKVPADVIRPGGTIITNDDASYLNPPKEFLKGNGWGEDYWGGKIGSFIRPPGYGLIYFPLLKTFGEPNAVTALKIFQYILFSASVFWFYMTLLLLIKKRKLSLIVTLFYGCSPFFMGFLSYTLTEGVTPSILLCYIYLLFQASVATSSGRKNMFYLLVSAVFAFLLIIRPVLGIFGVLLPVFLINDFYYGPKKYLFGKLIIYGSVALSLIAAWQTRNYRIAGKYVGMHPIYFEDGNTIYRAPFQAYWKFAGCWAEKGDHGFSYMVPMWEGSIAGDTSIHYVNAAIDSLPAHVISFFGKERLSEVFRDYQRAVIYQKKFYDKKIPMPIWASVEEKRSVDGFNELTEEYKKEFPFQFYILSPLKVFRLLAFHSNLSLYIFQKTYRGIFWMEMLRVICFTIHILCFGFLFLNMLKLRKDKMLSIAFGWAPFMYVFYLCYVQRGVEERYTLPVLPLLLIGMIFFLYKLYSKFRPDGFHSDKRNMYLHLRS